MFSFFSKNPIDVALEDLIVNPPRMCLDAHGEYSKHFLSTEGQRWKIAEPDSSAPIFEFDSHGIFVFRQREMANWACRLGAATLVLMERLLEIPMTIVTHSPPKKNWTDLQLVDIRFQLSPLAFAFVRMMLDSLIWYQRRQVRQKFSPPGPNSPPWDWDNMTFSAMLFAVCVRAYSLDAGSHMLSQSKNYDPYRQQLDQTYPFPDKDGDLRQFATGSLARSTVHAALLKEHLAQLYKIKTYTNEWVVLLHHSCWQGFYGAIVDFIINDKADPCALFVSQQEDFARKTFQTRPGR